MPHDSTLIIDVADGAERRLAFGVGPDGAEAVLALSAIPNLSLDDGDLRFLKRALAAIDLPCRYQDTVPPFDLEELAEPTKTVRRSSPPAEPPPPRMAGKRWSEEDHATLQALYRAGQTPAAIAASLGRTETAVTGRLIASGLARLQPTLRTEEQAP